MKERGLLETITNLEIAERQLERAIEIFLDKKDYVSALTLAGAAEEILGKILNQRGDVHWLDKILDGALRALGFRKRTFDSPEAKKARKEVAALANYHKNRMKHYNAGGSLTFEPYLEAVEMIERAMSNYSKLTGRQTGAMDRFKELVTFGSSHA